MSEEKMHNDDNLGLEFDRHEPDAKVEKKPAEEQAVFVAEEKGPQTESVAVPESKEVESAQAQAAETPAKPRKKERRKFFEKHNATGQDEDAQISFGAVLRDGRERMNMSLEEVESRCKVRAVYIKNLEENDLSHLPPPVYVCAYIKALGELYELPDEQINEIVRTIRSKISVRVHPDMLCPDSEDDDENSDRENNKSAYRSLIISITALAALLLIGIAVMFLFPSSGSDSTVISSPSVTFDSARLEKFIIPEMPEAVKQKIPSS